MDKRAAEGKEKRILRTCVRAIKLTSRSHVIVRARWGQPIHNPSKDRLKAVSDGVLHRDDGEFFSPPPSLFLRPRKKYF